MKKKTIIVLFFLLLVIYFSLAPFPLIKDFTFNPVWEQDISTSISNSPIGIPVPFRIGNYFGYASRVGKVLYSDKVLFNLAISDNGFINFSSVSKNLVLQDTERFVTTVIDAFGYPVFAENRFFVITTDRTGISERNYEGELLWEKRYSSIITCIDQNSEHLLIGKLNGEVELLDENGENIFSFKSYGSRIQATYGCAVSDNSRYLAIITGIDNQRMVLLEKKGETYELYAEEIIQDSFRRKVFIDFSEDGRFLFYENLEGLKCYNIPKNKGFPLPLSGKIKSYLFGKSSDLFYIASSDDETAELLIFNPDDSFKINFVFPGKALFLKKSESSLFLGVDNKLMCIDLQER